MSHLSQVLFLQMFNLMSQIALYITANVTAFVTPNVTTDASNTVFTNATSLVTTFLTLYLVSQQMSL